MELAKKYINQNYSSFYDNYKFVRRSEKFKVEVRSPFDMLSTPYVKCDYEKVYEPSEDSFLLLDALEKDQKWLNTRFKSTVPLTVEIGSGSGIVTTFMMQNEIPNENSVYLSTDLNPWALEATLDTSKRNSCESKMFDVLRSDLTKSIRKNQIDILVFNPPYVPAESVPPVPEAKEDGNNDEWLFLALDGGSEGMEVTQLLLDALPEAMTPQGVAYILFCARNIPDKIVKCMEERGWKSNLVEHRKAGWEVLSVYKFYKDS